MSCKRYELGGKGVNPINNNITKLLYVSTANYGGDWHSIPHIHSCTEIFYVTDGIGQFIVSDRVCTVSSNELIIVNPNVEHTESSLNSKPFEYIVLGIAGLELKFDEERDNGFYIFNFQNERDEFLIYLKSIVKELEAKHHDYEPICQNLFEVLTLKLMRITNFSINVMPIRRLSKECAFVKRYLDNHFKENISLDLLSELAHVNKYYLVHSFSREYKISPINYLINRRVQESRYLLSDTNHSMAQISNMLGFSSQSYFSQSFRKVEGMSPIEYRKQQRNMNVVKEEGDNKIFDL